MNIEVYYCNGTFLVHDTIQALELRERHRIICQSVNKQTPAAGPHCLDPHAAHIVCLDGLAIFKRLTRKRDICAMENKRRLEVKMQELAEREKELFIEKRLLELRQHDVIPSERTMKEFDAARMRIPVESTPDPELSVFESVTLSQEEVRQLLDTIVDQNGINLVYRDLYKKGFYLSSGMKFGCDLLAYMGDPVRYHAEYAVRLVPGTPEGRVNLDRISFPEINSFQRLTHSAKKTPLFVTVTKHDSDGTAVVLYWTIGERAYLNPESKNDELQAVEPNVSSCRSSRTSDRIKRVC